MTCSEIDRGRKHLNTDESVRGNTSRANHVANERVVIPRLVHLADARELKVADGDPDIRGWTVRTADGKGVGIVHDLIVDADSMKVCYIEARIDSAVLSGSHDQFALIPIRSAALDHEHDVVNLNAAIVDVRSLSPSDREALSENAASSVHDALPVVHTDEARFFGQRRRGREGANYLSPVDEVPRPPNELP